MLVYVRYPCPNCLRHLSLRLEYVNRRVVCNYCKQPFLSRAKVRVPASAARELVEAIHATNQAQGFAAGDPDRGTGEVVESPSPIELEVLGAPRWLDHLGQGDSPDLASRVAELERALARAEIRQARRLEQAQAIWDGERRALEHHTDLLCVRFSRQFDDERARQARQREALRSERDAALRRVEELAREQAELIERVAELEAELELRRSPAGRPASEYGTASYSDSSSSEPAETA